MDEKADLTKFVHNLKTNIKRSQSQLAHAVTKNAWQLAQNNVKVWKGDLKSKIAMKVSPKRGEVFIAGSWLDQAKAAANEFGVRPHFVNRDEFPEIDEWADSKGYVHHRYPNLVMVGGAGTRLGKANKFFEPTFMQVQRNLPMITAEVIRTNLMRTRA